MADTHKNFAKGTLTNSPGTAGTSFILGSGEGANFAANMPVTIVAAQTQPDSTNAEIGYVTAVSTDTLTITRAQQSTTAQNAVAGWLVLGTITAKALTDIETDVALKAPIASPTFTGTVSGITKSMVGLGNVDNTADTAKPVSTAQQTALDLKANLVSPSFTTPSLGVATATSINKLAITAPATGSTLTIANGKTLTANNSITLAGTDATTMTFPAATDTLAGLAAVQTITGAWSFNDGKLLLNGATSGTTTLKATAVAGTGTVTLPTSGTLATLAGTETLTGKTLTTPKLGSAGYIADANGNEILLTSATVASAVNEVTVTNAATTGNPTLSATGGDANINLGLSGKGTGAPLALGSQGMAILGSASAPATPAAGIGKFAMAGTGAVRPTFINSGGTVEKVLTDVTSQTSGAVGAYVATAETTTSTTYADLTTTTDTVTATIGPTGMALVNVYCGNITNNTGSIRNFISYAISGASTVAASDDRAVMLLTSAGNLPQTGFGATFLQTGLTAGSTTFKMKYKVEGGTGSFQYRRISVVPL